jgi:hypothetical protein
MITVYGPDIYNEEWFYPKFFNKGERALFYLKKVDAKYIILPHSILATEKCSPRDMIGLSTLPGESIGRGGPTLFFDPYQTCNGYLYPAWYLAISLTPLKQFEAGIRWFDVVCPENKVVVVKTTGFPACVGFDTAIKLYKRGWAENMENDVWTEWAKKIVQEYFETKIAKSHNIEENSTMIGLVGVRESLPPLITIGLRFTSVDVEEHQRTEHQFWFGINNGDNIEKILELGKDGETKTEIPIER